MIFQGGGPDPGDAHEKEESIGTQSATNSLQLTIVVLSVYRIINPFPANHDNCRLLSLLLMNFGSLCIANSMNPDQTAPLGAV